MGNEKGSEWSRWELHLHTPFTKKEDRFNGKNETEKWNNFYDSIREYIGEGIDPLRSISVIAITDYLSVDNYFKVKNDKALPGCVKLILPNVELRIKPIASNSPINIHCLFSPSVAHELDSRFFGKLKFEYNQNDFGATRSELIRLGRVFLNSQELPESEAYKTGLEQYVISYETLSKVFREDPSLRENTIIVVSNKSNDGVSGLKAHSDYFTGDISQLEATRRAIYQLSDMIFSSNQSDIAYFLGEKTDNEETVKEKCGSLKPCIHGCDAHTNDKIFSPDNDRYCWIKANPTFEGLKQVLYEPKERVCISSTIPDLKPSYYIIDHVEIKDNTNFSSAPIFFSDKLTCIIGGKSTGKSLLLHNMALAIDKAQVNKKQETAATNVKIIPGLKVIWRDGISSDDKGQQRKIVYIPQTYLNRLSDEEQETTEIDTIIQDIVLQDKKCLDFYQLLNRSISEKKQELAKVIVDFTKTVNDIKTLRDKLKELGDKTAIDKELKRLSDQLDIMIKEYNVTEKEVKDYQSAAERVQLLTAEISNLSKEEDIIKEMSSVIEVKPNKNIGLSIFADTFMKAVLYVKETADNAWMVQKENIIRTIKEKIKSIQETLADQNELVAVLQPKMVGNEQISKISDIILEEKNKLAKWLNLEASLKILQETYENQLDKLSKSFDDFGKFYSEYASSVNESFIASASDLDFSVKRVFRTEQFSQKITEVINNKSFSRFKDFDLRDIKENDLTSFNLSKLIHSLLVNTNETLQLKGGYNIEAGLRELLTDWYNIDYIVRMGGDSIQDMSPGKKALVLLRLLISLAESKCPILIDQPEDDLDNRSIFDELIHFIKEKKIDRQIITVTHNANIVLGGDAELVIIANQNGKDAPNHEYRFEYREGAIEDNSPVSENGVVVSGILNSKGVQEHICEILEGGEKAFALRKHKYRFIKI